MANTMQWENYQHLLDSLEGFKQGALIADENYRIRASNKSADQLLGRTGNELVGLSLISEQDYDKELNTYYLTSFDGNSLMVPLTLKFVKEANQLNTPDSYLVSIESSSQEEIQLSQMVSQNEHNMEVLFESIPLGLMVVTKDNIILRANEQVAHMFQTDTDSLVGKPIGEGLRCSISMDKGCGNSFHCKLCELRRTAIQCRKEGVARQDQVVVLQHNFHGKKVTKHYTVNAIHLFVYKDDVTIITIQDITDQIIYETTLIEAKEIAEQGHKAKTEFLSNMSHEIRTPLNGIIGMIDLTLNKLKDDELIENISIAKSCGKNLLSVINDILDFSALESGKFKLHPRGFKLYDLLNEIQKEHSIKAFEKGLEFRVETREAEDVTLFADSDRLKQVLNNLIVNGIKFTEKGRVRLVVKELNQDNETINYHFIVEDTGIGIDGLAMSKLFKSFSQIDGSYTRKGSGNGLGLSICKQLVEMMGGTIEVDSIVGSGSSFHFKLLMRKGQINSEVAIVPQKHAFRKGKILLVEDDRINQIVTRKMLVDVGFEVDLASNGFEAVSLFRSNHYHLILMDVQMPYMDGIKATSQIREMEAGNTHTPIIALTAFVLEGERVKFLEAGMDDYLAKPVEYETLLNLIDRYNEIDELEAFDMTAFKLEPVLNEQGEIEFVEHLDQLLLTEEEKDGLLYTLEFVSKMTQLDDYDKAEESIHKMKSIVEKKEAQKLKQLLFKLELAARKASRQQMSELIEHIVNELEMY